MPAYGLIVIGIIIGTILFLAGVAMLSKNSEASPPLDQTNQPAHEGSAP